MCRQRGRVRLRGGVLKNNDVRYFPRRAGHLCQTAPAIRTVSTSAIFLSYQFAPLCFVFALVILAGAATVGSARPKMKQFLLLLALLFALSITSGAAADRPNLIWIMADDLGYGDLGCYGQKVIQTPHLDRMAREGLRFTHFYAGATVCAPSRSVLMTGQHHGHTRVRGNAGQTNPAAQALREGDVTVARVLKDAGYATALIGKWGLGNVGDAESGLPRRQGFDRFFGYLSQVHAHNHFPDYLWDGKTDEKLNLDPQSSDHTNPFGP